MLELLSVIIQVGSFKLTGKRMFRMAPLHHHFELMGWSESKIIVRFWIAGAGVRAVCADDFEIEVRVAVRPGFDLAGKRVLVVGLARTGVAVSLFSAGYGAIVTATDEKPEDELGETAARLRAAGVRLEFGATRAGHISGTGLDRREPRRAGEASGA